MGIFEEAALRPVRLPLQRLASSEAVIQKIKNVRNTALLQTAALRPAILIGLSVLAGPRLTAPLTFIRQAEKAVAPP